MSGPFSVGDVVVRVSDDYGTMPVGTVCRVIGTTPPVQTEITGEIGQGLILKGHPHPRKWAWAASGFRHLPKAEEQFTAQIRACKPIRKGVSA